MFYIKKEVEVCTRTYEGGCANIQETNLNKYYKDRNYTVIECYDLCTTVPECGGFFMVTERVISCLLVREGCVNNNRQGREYYAMADCMTANSIF